MVIDSMVNVAAASHTSRCFCALHFVQYEMSALEREHMRMLLVDRRNKVMEVVGTCLPGGGHQVDRSGGEVIGCGSIGPSRDMVPCISGTRDGFR